MADKETDKGHIYNLKELARKVTFSNAYQRLVYLFRGIDFYIDNDMLQRTIDALDKEHNERVEWLKSKMK